MGFLCFLILMIASQFGAVWLSNWKGCMPFTKLELMTFALPAGVLIALVGIVFHSLGILGLGVWAIMSPMLPWTWYDPKKARW